MAYFSVVSSSRTQGFSLLHNMSYYRYKFIVSTDLSTYIVKQIIDNAQMCEEFSATMASSSPFTTTVKFLKAGYYRIQLTPSSTPEWQYKNVNDAISITNDITTAIVHIFCFKDLKQH